MGMLALCWQVDMIRWESDSNEWSILNVLSDVYIAGLWMMNNHGQKLSESVDCKSTLEPNKPSHLLAFKTAGISFCDQLYFYEITLTVKIMYTHTPFSRPEKRNAHTQSSQQQFSELYFSYSSNMSPTTMKGRYPNSLFCGIAKLSGWKWSINSTQYANIIQSGDDVVYGALYFISAADEFDLDVSEGVPDHYEKQWHEVERLDGEAKGTGQVVRALMYVDAQRPDEGTIKDDYVVWIRKAVRDAKQYGLPDEYVEKCIQPYLPDSDEGEVEKDMDPVRIMFGKDQFK